MKDRFPAALRTATVAVSLLISSAAARGEAPSLSWETNATSVALLNGEKMVWKLACDPAQPKTYFHPLATVGGDVLTAFQPPDHVWHRGLWWSWKFINGLNYWEEDKKTGKSQGVNELTGAKMTTNPDFSARAELTFSYHPPDKPPVMTETRTLTVSPPDAKGNYRIDWTSVFTAADQSVKLDRTPPHSKGGVSWGGYAGLSLRFPPGLKGWSFLTSENARGAAAANGKNAAWVDFSGSAAGIAVFDHPGNARHPSAWYLNEQLPYFSPALLYSDPLELSPKQELKMRYRVLVHSKPISKEDLARESEAFSRQ